MAPKKAVEEDAEHFILQSDFVTNPKGTITCAYIGKLEEVNKTIELLNSHNLKLKLPHKNISNEEKTPISSIYNREMLNHVNFVYKKDFENFNYPIL
jgi:hypothetical protein